MNTLNEGKVEPMKFIINGRTFDTATAATVAIVRGITLPAYNNMVGDSEVRYERVLYRTAKGAFFRHDHETEKLVKGGRPVTTDSAYELTSEEAMQWIVKRRAMVLDATGLALPPEA